MLKTKSLTVIALLLLLLVVTACQRLPDDQGQIAIPSASMDNSVRHIQRQLDTNLSVDAEVNAPSDIEKLDILLVTPQRLDTQVQTLKNWLIDDSKIANKEEYDGRGGGSKYVFRTVDGKYLGVGNNNVHFITENFQTYIRQILFRYIIPGDTTYDLSRFKQNRDLDLPFMPYRQAEDKAKKLLTSLGISTYDVVESYALDYKTLQNQEKAMKEKGDLTSPKDGSITTKDRWSEEDEIYYMIFRSSLNNIPVYPLNHGSVEKNTIVLSGYINVAYSQRGLEYLRIDYPYEKKSIDREEVKIISADEALAVATRKYENVILTDPTTITAIELYYVPTLINKSRDEFRMVPAWSFELEEIRKRANDEPYTAHSRIIIDATTGGEIL